MGNPAYRTYKHKPDEVRIIGRIVGVWRRV
jgi:SOS-response transcriptional repressor LexA